MKKQTTSITERHGGVHNAKAYKKVQSMLYEHGYIKPRLYHLILLDGIESINANRFQKALKAICLKLRNEGIACRWRACLELEKKKGLHFHVFLLVNAFNKNSCSIINAKNEGWLKTYLENHAMTMHLSQPKADIHRVGSKFEGKRQNYATLAGDKLNDCLEWVSYLVKKRSKPEHIKYIYFSSRDSKTSAKHLN